MALMSWNSLTLTEEREKYLSVAEAPVQIRFSHLQTTSLERYLQTNLPDRGLGNVEIRKKIIVKYQGSFYKVRLSVQPPFSF
jgi:predicted house-cleaning NTP pyrophosphatase (Maf/HAM1 superfamily)